MRRKILIWLTMAFFSVTAPIISLASVGSNSANQQTTPPGSKRVQTYTVKKGNTLWDLSHKLHITLKKLIADNHIVNPRLLQIGKVLKYTTWNAPNANVSQSAQSSSNGGHSSPSKSHVSKSATSSSSSASSGSDGSSNASSTSTKNTVLNDSKVIYCTLTAYTAGPLSTGKSPGDPGYDVTSTGQTAQQGVTVAVDPNVIPYGTKLYIPGIGYRVAEDTGGAIQGDHIDIFYNSRSAAVKFGVQHHKKVYLLPNWFHIPVSG